MTAAELREEAGTEPVDPDYPVTPVPASARRGVVSISVVLIRSTVVAPTLIDEADKAVNLHIRLESLERASNSRESNASTGKLYRIQRDNLHANMRRKGHLGATTTRNTVKSRYDSYCMPRQQPTTAPTEPKLSMSNP